MASDLRIKRWLLVFFITAYLGAPVATVAGDLDPAESSGVVTRLAHGLAACLGRLSFHVQDNAKMVPGILVALSVSSVASMYSDMIRESSRDIVRRCANRLRNPFNYRNSRDESAVADINWVGEFPKEIEEWRYYDQNPELRNQYSDLQKSVNAFLLFGPPGNGKTLLARALARATNRPLVVTAGGDHKDPYVGGTEQKIRDLFDSARKQRAVLFFDEVDSLAADRYPLNPASSNAHAVDALNTFLSQITDQRNQDIVILAATNKLEKLEQAAIREGRLDTKIYIGNPDDSERKALIEAFCNRRWVQVLPNNSRLANVPLLSSFFRRDPARVPFIRNPQDITQYIAKKSDGFSRAAIDGLIVRAGRKAVFKSQKEGAAGPIAVSTAIVDECLQEMSSASADRAGSSVASAAMASQVRASGASGSIKRNLRRRRRAMKKFVDALKKPVGAQNSYDSDADDEPESKVALLETRKKPLGITIDRASGYRTA